MIVERAIKRVLEAAIQPYLDSPALFKAFLIDEGLDEDEADGAATYIEANPPHVNLGYPRQNSSFPYVAITVGQETTAQDWLGEDAETLDDDGEYYTDDDGNPVDHYERRWDHRFDIYLYTDNADTCSWYYALLRRVLMQARPVFQAAPYHLDEITYSGAELVPDARYLPTNIYTRRLSMQCRSDQAYELSTQRGTSIVGAHVDDGVTTDVTAEVTPYVE